MYPSPSDLTGGNKVAAVSIGEILPTIEKSKTVFKSFTARNPTRGFPVAVAPGFSSAGVVLSNPSSDKRLAAAKDHVRAAGESVKKAGDELKFAAVAKGVETLQGAQVKVQQAGEHAYEPARSELETLTHSAEDYIRANPLKAAVILFGAGFVAGAQTQSMD